MPVVFVVLVVLLLPFKEPFQKLVAYERSAVSGTVPRECVTVRHHFVILKCC